MTLSDLVFLLAALTAVVTVVRILVAAIRGRLGRALSLLRRLALGTTAYLLLGLAVSFAAPQRVIPLGEPWCFDDWCLTLDEVERSPVPSGSVVTTAFWISSTARRVSQHANGAWIFLVDAEGNRYDPEPDAGEVPLTVELRPGASVRASRRFLLPAGSRAVGLVTGHGGPYCGPMDFLVIGQASCAFGRPTLIRLPSG